MRKVDSVDLCDQVQAEIAELRAFYEAGWKAFAGKPHAAARQSTLSELKTVGAYLKARQDGMTRTALLLAEFPSLAEALK